MRKVEVTQAQIETLARELARACGQHDPDVLIAPGERSQVVALPWGLYHVVALPHQSLPIWEHFVQPAEFMLAKAGALAGVEFVKLTPQPLSY